MSRMDCSSAAAVIARSQDARLAVGPGLLGRVLDGFGQPMDGGPPIEADRHLSAVRAASQSAAARHITERLVTGIRSIDSLLACGKGQRIGLFGGSGVGKSTLLGAMSRKNSAQVSVIALIGERNREVKAFLEHELGPEGMKRSVVVVATSDRPAPLRIRAAFVALAAAEYFRDQGADVLLVMDSVTRLAMAQREIGLAAGEPPSQKGYTPSVFALLPKIFERAGNFENRIDHRLLHRAGGRRRFQRADLRRGARHSGRAFHSFARSGFVRTLSGDRRSEFGQPACRTRSSRRKNSPPSAAIREALATLSAIGRLDPAGRARAGRESEARSKHPRCARRFSNSCGRTRKPTLRWMRRANACLRWRRNCHEDVSISAAAGSRMARAPDADRGRKAFHASRTSWRRCCIARMR